MHNDVAKVLVRWMRKQGYTPASKDMEVYLEFAMFVKDKPMAGFNSPEMTNDITLFILIKIKAAQEAFSAALKSIAEDHTPRTYKLLCVV